MTSAKSSRLDMDCAESTDGIHREQDIAVETDAQRFVVQSLDVDVIDFLERLFLLVHVQANAGTQAGADGRGAQDFIQFAVADKKTGCRPDSSADGGSTLGLGVGVI